MVEVEEKTCPVFRGIGTALIKVPECGGKFIRKEPVLASEKICGHLKGPKDPKGCRTGEDDDYYYYFECENGHVVVRPSWYANVPVVAPGTIKSPQVKGHSEWYAKDSDGVSATPHAWFGELSDDEKDQVWKK